MSTFRVSQYAPANETEADLWFERSNIDGAVLGCVGYGVHLTLFLQCFHLVWNQRARSPRYAYAVLTYISTLFVLGTIGNAANTRFNEMTFVDDRDYPGGPNAFFVNENSYWFNVMGYGVYIANTWLQDGLLVYRFILIWNFRYWILVVPTMMYIVSIIMSCFLLSQIAQPGNNIWQKLSINFALTYWSTSIATTILLTTLIVGRLMFMRYRLNRLFGSSRDAPYLSVSTMLVESAFLYSATALVFLVSYAKNNALQNVFLPVLGQVQSIAPLLILLRVAQGRSWTKDTWKETRTLRVTPVEGDTHSIGLSQLRFALPEQSDKGIDTDPHVGEVKASQSTSTNLSAIEIKAGV